MLCRTSELIVLCIGWRTKEWNLGPSLATALWNTLLPLIIILKARSDLISAPHPPWRTDRDVRSLWIWRGTVRLEHNHSSNDNQPALKAHQGEFLPYPRMLYILLLPFSVPEEGKENGNCYRKRCRFGLRWGRLRDSWHVFCARAQLEVSVPAQVVLYLFRDCLQLGGTEESREESQNTICEGIVWFVVLLPRKSIICSWSFLLLEAEEAKALMGSKELYKPVVGSSWMASIWMMSQTQRGHKDF